MLPSLIPIPAAAAASFRVQGSCTGRDLSWALALLMAAVDCGDSGEVLISEEAIRQSLFIKRSDAIVRENERWTRLRDLRIKGRPAPCVPFESIGGQGEWPRRHKDADGNITVLIDEDLAERFTDTEGDVVYLPRRLLELADSRYTVPMMMHVLAWSAGDYPRSWKVTDTSRRVRIHVPLDHLIDVLDLPASMKPSQVVSRVLSRAAAEISAFTDYEVEMAPRIAQSSGRIRDIEVTIHVPDVEAALVEQETAGEILGQVRKRKPRPRPTELSRPTKPVTVSRSALDAAVPLSVVKVQQSNGKTPIASNSNHAPGSSFKPVVHGVREDEIEW